MIRIFPLLIALFLLSACTQAPVPAVEPAPTARAQLLGTNDYLVKRGDTLYRIAKEHGVDHMELAALNNLDNPAAIKEGQVLRLRRAVAPAAATATVAPIGAGAVVESRPLGTGAASAEVPSGWLREPRGGKEPYSAEADARLNRRLDAAPESSPPPSPAVAAAPAAPASTDGIVWAWPTTASLSAPYNEAGSKGFDFAGRQGDPVLAASDGKVLYVGDALAGYGKLVIVKHNAEYLSVYAHNSRILVKEGQSVRRGQKIGEMGKTGTDTVKLHFEVRKQGKPVDPVGYLPKR
ncbi:MAG: peptidoglycan DD-metalloendopeptidase family protein [Dechloromonas sp.]|nr:peptidoglycan DD-metalloendopeptidase family protein [Dechloromonas sp.]